MPWPGCRCVRDCAGRRGCWVGRARLRGCAHENQGATGKEACGRGWRCSAWRQGGAALTALDGVGGDLQRQRPAVGLRDVDAEDQPHPRVLPPDVRLPLAELDVRVSELQDPGAVDAAGNKSLRSAPDPCPIPGDRSPKGLCGPAQGPGRPDTHPSSGLGPRQQETSQPRPQAPGAQAGRAATCSGLQKPQPHCPGLTWTPQSRTRRPKKVSPAAPKTSFHLRFWQRPP